MAKTSSSRVKTTSKLPPLPPIFVGVQVASLALSVMKDISNVSIIILQSTWGLNLLNGASKEDGLPTCPQRMLYRGPSLGWTRTRTAGPSYATGSWHVSL